MIDKRELRIGNWVYGVSDRTEYIISLGCNFCTTGKNLIDLQNTSLYDDISGIELTPDILVKAGFENCRKGSTVLKLEIAYKDEEFPCSLQESGSGILICRSGMYSICVQCEFVHQLQNLYFCLTGQELTINL